MKIKNIKEKLKNKETRWLVAITISFITTILFALYNGFLGLYKHSIWNGSICVYYLFLVALKLVILTNEHKMKNIQNEELKSSKRKKVFFVLSIFILVMNFSLVVPISLMVLSQKQVEFGLVPAIIVATYTTYKITMAIINYVKFKSYENLAYRQIRTINLIDAILSVLTLQNTLIMVNDGSISGSMLTLTAITSFAGIVLIIILSIISLVKYIKENKNTIPKIKN